MENIEELSVADLIEGLNFISINNLQVNCNYVYNQYLYYLGEKCPLVSLLYM